MSEQIKDLRKLCILNVKDSDDDDKIRSLCESFGRLVHFNRPPNKQQLAFPLYQNESDAQRAKEGLAEKGYRVEYANKKPSDNSSEDTGRQKRSEFRSRQNLADGSENGYEADSSTVHMDNRPYGICIKCGEKAFYNCGRCREFYCSEECQESDWLIHKPNCISMPKLVPAKSTFSLRASRTNLSDTSDKDKSLATNHVMKGVDAADGQQNGDSLPVKFEQVPKPSDAVSNSDKRSKAESLIQENRATPTVAHSPRAKMLAQTNGVSPKPPAPATKGLMSVSIPNNSEVFITHVKNHRSVYIRSSITNDEYSKLLTEVEEATKKQPKLTRHPKVHDVVAAPFDGLYYRATVVNIDKINDGIIKVGFIDFGNTAEVPFDVMKSLPEELQTHRRLTILVVLKDLHDDYEQIEKDKMVNHLDDLCESGRGLKVKGDADEINAKAYVELLDMITNQSLSEVFKGMVQKRYRIEDLTQKIVDNVSNQELMIITPEKIHDNYVTCILKDDVNVFMDGDGKIQEYGASVKNAPAYKPKVKELCVVEIKEPEGKIWYRCVYQQGLVDDRAQVYCFDYGKIMNVRENNIRALTSDLAFEITSFVGRLDNGDDLSKDRKDELAANLTVTAKTILFDGDLHRITVL